MTKEEKEKGVTNKEETAGRDISLVGFIFAVASIFVNLFTFGGMSLAGLVLSIIGRIQTSKVGQPNAYALAGIIVSGVVTVLTFVVFALLAAWLLVPRTDEEGRYIDCSGEYEYSVECQTEDALLYPQTQS